MTTTPVDFDQALERIGRGKYVNLTTFRKTGAPVPTPVGCLVHDGTLYVLTPPDSGKVKRIRNGGRVLVEPCSMQGAVPADATAVEGTARLLDEAGTRRVEALMVRRFLMYRLVRLADRVTRRRRPLVAVAVTAS
ncbi:PPOX class F420-dependent oxidoreductase [Streptomyces sp. NPDC088387]|uniref:PPOX class F420-dependent oxidoreductase n=1 Tax=Streptomyces sp. NPDC088387 TaxID=3365859 RepID=UPI00382ADCC0